MADEQEHDSQEAETLDFLEIWWFTWLARLPEAHSGEEGVTHPATMPNCLRGAD